MLCTIFTIFCASILNCLPAAVRENFPNLINESLANLPCPVRLDLLLQMVVCMSGRGNSEQSRQLSLKHLELFCDKKSIFMHFNGESAKNASLFVIFRCIHFSEYLHKLKISFWWLYLQHLILCYMTCIYLRLAQQILKFRNSS